jgi:hypothetical protein
MNLVEIGDTVYVVDDTTYQVHKVTVDSNPSEIIWATIKKNKHSEAFGAHRWAKSQAEAERLAVKLSANVRKPLTEGESLNG